MTLSELKDQLCQWFYFHCMCVVSGQDIHDHEGNNPLFPPQTAWARLAEIKVRSLPFTSSPAGPVAVYADCYML